MKNFMKNFKNFLLESRLADYNLDGTIHLYHYSKSDEYDFTLDPDQFVSNTSSHSRKEKEISDVPRVFFYTDPNKTEHLISKGYGRKLFKTEVSSSRVYNLKEDPDDFIQKVKHPIFGLRKGIEWNDLLNAIKEEYDGVFYSIGNPDIVAWFKPIKVERVEEIPAA